MQEVFFSSICIHATRMARQASALLIAWVLNDRFNNSMFKLRKLLLIDYCNGYLIIFQ